MNVYVFLGPTLHAADAARILDATYLPPVRLADVYQVVSRQRPSADRHRRRLLPVGACGLAQGDPLGDRPRAFTSSARPAWAPCGRPSSRPSECTASAGSSRPTVTATSRASARPIRGRRRGGGRARTARRAAISAHPKRWSTSDARWLGPCPRGVIAKSTRLTLVADAKAAFFPDRGYAPLLANGRVAGLPEHELAALERWLPSGRVDQKRLDAVAMLGAMRDFLAADPPPARADLYSSAPSTGRTPRPPSGQPQSPRR